MDNLGEATDISAVAGGSIQVDAPQLAAGASPPEAAQAENASSSSAVLSMEAVATEAPGQKDSAGAVAAPMETPAAGRGQEHAVGATNDDGASGFSGRSDNEGDDDDDDDSQQEYEGSEDEGKEARLRLAAVELSSPAVVQRVGEKLKGYRLQPDRLEDLRETLTGFLGTKNYHNYTNHKKATDPSCKRCACLRQRRAGLGRVRRRTHRLCVLPAVLRRTYPTKGCVILFVATYSTPFFPVQAVQIHLHLV